MTLCFLIIISESTYRYLDAAVCSYIICRQHILLKLNKDIFRPGNGKYGQIYFTAGAETQSNFCSGIICCLLSFPLSLQSVQSAPGRRSVRYHPQQDHPQGAPSLRTRPGHHLVAGGKTIISHFYCFTNMMCILLAELRGLIANNLFLMFSLPVCQQFLFYVHISGISTILCAFLRLLQQCA